MAFPVAIKTSDRLKPRLTHVRGSNAIPGISQAVIIGHSRIAYLSGHVPLTATGEVPSRFDEQLAQVFANLRITLADIGASTLDLARITIYVVGLNDVKLALIRTARDEFTGHSGTPPASALLGVTALFHPDVQVEVDAIASLPI